jgi:hypothetical protein
MATTSGNDPLSPSRQLGCDTCRISGQKLAAGVGIEPTSYALTGRRIALMLTGKIGWSGVRESNPPHLLGRQRPKATRPTPLKWRALCLALRLPVSMRRIVACAGLWTGVFGWSESVDPALSVPVCPRPCAGGKANQNSIALTRGWNCPSNECDHDGLKQPVAAHVSSGFLMAVIMAARFLRSLKSEVKHRVNTPLTT